jgi:hypothetical protein
LNEYLQVGMERTKMRASKREKDDIQAYVEGQAHETVLHLEKAASEMSPSSGIQATASERRLIGGFCLPIDEELICRS